MADEFHEDESLIESERCTSDLIGERRPPVAHAGRLALTPTLSLGKMAGCLFQRAVSSTPPLINGKWYHKFAALGVIVLGFFFNAFAGPKVTISTSDNSTIHIPYDPPNQNKTKWDVTGASAEQNGANVRLHEVKIKEYSLAGGAPELVAETPECLYDRAQQDIFSDAHLKVHAQDGRFFVEGDGFLMQQTNSSLFISNQVHSTIEMPAATNPAAGLTVIYSQRCRFRRQTETEPGMAVYQGDVRLTDPQTKLSCETLTADLPVNAPGEVSHIHRLIAETGVVIDFKNPGGEIIHATGQKAVYSHGLGLGDTNEWLELSGEPRAAISNGWMTADVFLMNRTTGVLRGEKNVHLHYLTGSKTNFTDKPTVVEASDIFADQFEYNTGTRVTRFWGDVRGHDPRLNLSAGWLETVLPKSESGQTNHLERLLARTNVVIDFVNGNSVQTNHASGQQAIYNYSVAGFSTNETVMLTGRPRITLTNGWMTADEITSDRVQGWVSGTGNQHSVYAKLAGEPPELDTQIYSDHAEFHNDSGVSIYQGNVRAYDPEMNLRAPRLTLRFAKSALGTNRLENAFASGGVTLDFGARAFGPGDLTNFNAFAAAMNSPRRPVDEFVRSHLRQPTRDLLAGYPGTTNPKLTNDVIEDLNRLAGSGAIYDPTRFAGVALPGETSAWLKSEPQGADLMQLNRLLLLAAFPGELFRNQKGDATRGTGEEATYSHSTPGGDNDVLIELTGSPKLEKPRSTLTARDKILYDQAAGKVYLIGQGDLLTQMTGLSPKPINGESSQPRSKKR